MLGALEYHRFSRICGVKMLKITQNVCIATPWQPPKTPKHCDSEFCMHKHTFCILLHNGFSVVL